MEPATILLAVAILLIMLLLHQYYRNPPGFPPGPIGLFPLGYIPFIKPRTFIKFAELKKKYGDVVGIRIGFRRAVLLLSYDAIEEALVKKADNFAGRWRSKFADDMNRKCGVIFIDGDVWQEHRRFILRVLRDFGLGRNLSEEYIQVEAQRLTECLAVNAGHPCEPFDTVTRAVSSIICRIALSEDPSLDDTDFTRVVNSFRETIKLPFHLFPPFGFPFLDHLSFLMYRFPAIKQVMETLETTMSYILKRIENHRATIDWNGEPRDVTDAYLQEQAKREKSGEPHTFTDFQTLRVVMELFIAGTDTTANSLHWLLLMMALNSDIQRRVHREIDDGIGRTHQPSMKDKTNMPYLSATLDEVQRFSSIAANAMQHRNFKEDTVRGYTIPADTIVIPCIYSCHHDPDVWQEPEQFRPERFLTDDGKEYRPRHELIPFSLGRRSCLGEALAKMELFLFGAFLMQRFSVELSKEKPIDLEEILLGSDGGIRSVEGFQLILHIRE